MIGAIVWRAALLALALVAIGVHLDRAVLRTPILAQSVPEAFRGSAQPRVAQNAFASGDATLALAEAERLVQRRPLPAEHLRFLAQAQFAAGETDQSVLTIQYAAQRGWRDPLAQESLLRLALDAGDGDEAARRFTALFLRRDTEDALLTELAPAVLGEPQGEGRKTFVAIFAGAKRWQSRFLSRGARVISPDVFADIMVAASDQGARFECASLRQLASQIKAGNAQAGARIEALIAAQC